MGPVLPFELKGHGSKGSDRAVKGCVPEEDSNSGVVILALPWHHRIFSRLRSLEIILRAEGHSEPEAATEEGVRFPTVCP